MGQEFRSLCPVEARRMLWLIGFMFAVVVIFQYFEFPYGNSFSSELSAEKNSLGWKSGFDTGGSTPPSAIFGDTSQTDSSSTSLNPNNSSSTIIDGAGAMANRSNTLERNVDVDEGNKALDNSLSEGLTKQNETSLVDNSTSLENARDSEPSSENRYAVDGNSSINSSSIVVKDAAQDGSGSSKKSVDPDHDFEPEGGVGSNREIGGSNPSADNDSVPEEARESESSSEKRDTMPDVLGVPNASGTFDHNVTDIEKGKVGSNTTSWTDEESYPLEPSNKESTEQNNSSSVNNGPVLEDREFEEESSEKWHVDGDSSMSSDGKEKTTFTSGNADSLDSGFAPPLPVAPAIASSPNTTFATNLNANGSTPEASDAPNTTSDKQDTKSTSDKSGEVGQLPDSLPTSDGSPSVNNVHEVMGSSEMKTPEILSIADMNKLLLQRRAVHHPVSPLSLSVGDKELLYARSQIESAPIIVNDPELYAPLYRNLSMFKRSYELMESILKVYIYKEGQKPIFHHPVLKGIYASEGWFMKLLQANKKFVTRDGSKAHLFYLPFSSRMLEETLYVADSHSHKNLIEHLKNYLDMVAAKYPFWNRTDGADHFLVACHDWAPAETRRIMSRTIRALCNTDLKEGYVFGKDVSLPETMVRNNQNPLRDLGGKPASQRTLLAFFAGKMHGYLRPILIQQWNKDPDMKIIERIPKAKGASKIYMQYMKSSKYCICPKGYEVNSPRVVEAIFFECVPVIISDNFVPPFFEIFNWESFAVFVPEKDIPNLKSILLSISESRYRQMQLRVKKIQKHFLWHPNPVKYDVFHMILHSIWYKRVFEM